ncbi:MAG TPA: DUF6513 domain-containing protein [Stellaceae bacterium]|nr:DUF6513 domain-containing protein [Stellaceae bacterium]
MSRHTLFLTGHLAEKRLHHVLAGLSGLDFTWTVHDIGIQVAALMTAEIIRRRLPQGALGADRVIVPGFCRGDLEALGRELGLRVERGPEDLHELPNYLGDHGKPVDRFEPDVRIFAEITDAPQRSTESIMALARLYAADGAEVIDLGCLPETAFPHLEEAVAAIKESGLEVSVDSADLGELKRGAAAGAHYVLSLDETSLDLAFAFDTTPVIIPTRPDDLPSLYRACERLLKEGRPFIADAILAPIPFGFTASLLRYAELRRRLPGARILMGIGNVTELTDADTTGINALLFGMIAELGISEVLTVQKSPHCRNAIKEADRARRIMGTAMRLQRLPQGFDPGLLALHDRRPGWASSEEIAETKAQLRDTNFRIELAEDGIHLYNRDLHRVATDAFALFPALTPAIEHDGAHAFYLGVELARAEIAWRLGKHHAQDEELRWGVAYTPEPASAHRGPGPTLPTRRKRPPTL